MKGSIRLFAKIAGIARFHYTNASCRTLWSGMRVIGIAGWSGAGKTTLLKRLIPELTSRGLRVSTIKHAHHTFDIDYPGKDSYEHRMAGATEVLLVSGKRWALMHELREEEQPPLKYLLGLMADVDIVLVEGFKEKDRAKIEIYRSDNGKSLLFPEIDNMRAVVSDIALPEAAIPVLDRDDIAAVADAVIAAAEPVEAWLI